MNRIIGVETEYGLVGRDSGPHRSGRLSPGEAAHWLFRPIEREHASSNVFLRNGGRLYLDVGSHPEFATAECLSVGDVLLHERAGDQIMSRLAVRAGEEATDDGRAIDLRLFKNNVDSHGNSYGSHENYSIARDLDLTRLAALLTPFLVTRQLICGSGQWRPDGFRISQRAQHLHDLMSSMTTRSRPLINTRDEPLADPTRLRRLHLIAGDSNLSEPTIALKLSVTVAVIGAAEALLLDGSADLPVIELADPAAALRQLSADRRAVLTLADGRTMTAVDIQWSYLAAVRDTLDTTRWERVLHCLELDDLDSLEREVEWVAKERLLARYADSRGLAPTDRRLAQVDLAFHEITGPADRPRGLLRLLEARGAHDRITTEAAVTAAMAEPPADTRAILRSRLIRSAQENSRRYSVDWVAFTAHDLPGPSGQRAELGLRLDDPFAVADDRVDDLIRTMAGGWQPPRSGAGAAGVDVG